jgi:hypothetical protein
MLPETVMDRHIAAQVTDDAWGAELRKLFGKRAGDVRYTSQGKGEPDSTLRQLYEAREAARIAYDRARGYGERGERVEPR